MKVKVKVEEAEAEAEAEAEDEEDELRTGDVSMFPYLLGKAGITNTHTSFDIQ